MSYFNKIGLLILNNDQTKFMVCEKNKFTTDFIMPGGQLEANENDRECLVREIREELAAEVVESSLEFVGEYTDVAAGDPTKDVCIRLYQGCIAGEPVPSAEIIGFHWLGRGDLGHPRLSPIIRHRIMPDLIARKILI